MKPCLHCGRLARGSRCRVCLSVASGANPYATADWRRLSRQTVERDGACVCCGSPGRCLNAHHVQPRAEGGPDSLDNLVTLCASCHGRLEARERAA